MRIHKKNMALGFALESLFVALILGFILIVLPLANEWIRNKDTLTIIFYVLYVLMLICLVKGIVVCITSLLMRKEESSKNEHIINIVLKCLALVLVLPCVVLAFLLFDPNDLYHYLFNWQLF